MRNRVYRFIIAILLGLAVFFGILAYREHKPFMDAKVSHEAIKKAGCITEAGREFGQSHGSKD